MNLSQDILKKLITSNGNCAVLTADEKKQYYEWFCNRLGLDPASLPFQFLKDEKTGREKLYCDRGGAAQLSKHYRVTHENRGREIQGMTYLVYTRAILPDGRFVDSVGAVALKNKYGPLEGEMLANALMKADTKSKRRGALDLLGLGMLDEAEMDDTDLERIENYQPPAQVKEQLEKPLPELVKPAPKVEPKPEPKAEPKPEPKKPEVDNSEIGKARAMMKKCGVNEADVVELLVASYKLENITKLEELATTFIEALQDEKYCQRAAAAIKKRKPEVVAKQPEPEANQEMPLRDFAEGNPYKDDKNFDWKTVAVHFGKDKGTLVHSMTRYKFNFYYGKWPFNKPHRFSDDDYKLDAALVIAAREE